MFGHGHGLELPIHSLKGQLFARVQKCPDIRIWTSQIGTGLCHVQTQGYVQGWGGLCGWMISRDDVGGQVGSVVGWLGVGW